MHTFITSQTLLPRLLGTRSQVPCQQQGRSGEPQKGSQGEPPPLHPHPAAARDRTHRRHGSGHTGAPRGGQGLPLLLRDASGEPRSRKPPGPGAGGGERPPGWALRGPPARARPALTSRSGGHGQSPAALAPTGTSGPGAAAEAPTPRELAQSRGPPSLSARREAVDGRGCPLSALPRLPAAHATPTARGRRRARPRPPGGRTPPGLGLASPAQSPLRGGRSPRGGRAGGLARRTGAPGEPVRGVGGGRGGSRHAPLRLRRPRGPFLRADPGRGGGPGLRAPGKRRRAWRFPGQPRG